MVIAWLVRSERSCTGLGNYTSLAWTPRSLLSYSFCFFAAGSTSSSPPLAAAPDELPPPLASACTFQAHQSTTTSDGVTLQLSRLMARVGTNKSGAQRATAQPTPVLLLLQLLAVAILQQPASASAPAAQIRAPITTQPGSRKSATTWCSAKQLNFGKCWSLSTV